MYVYVAPSTPVGVWSMALGLRQRIEYYAFSVPNLYLAQRYYYRGWYCSRNLSPQFIVEITVAEKGHSYDSKKGPRRVMEMRNGNARSSVMCMQARDHVCNR